MCVSEEAEASMRLISTTLTALLALGASRTAAQDLDSATVSETLERPTEVTARDPSPEPLSDARRRLRVMGGALLGVVLVGGLTAGIAIGGEERCGSLDCLGRGIIGGTVVGALALPLVPLLAHRIGQRAGGRGRFGGAIAGTVVGAMLGGLSFSLLRASEDYGRAIAILAPTAAALTVAGTVIGYELSQTDAPQPTVAVHRRGARLGLVSRF